MILDSGDRTEFASGAVRDMRVGKGRMDLLPLGVVEEFLNDESMVLHGIRCFVEENDTRYLYFSLASFVQVAYDNCRETMILEVGKQFEEGAKKYGENNWQKGIEPKYYIDSAIRHYLKWRRGDKDEPHDRAFVWNIMCCIWEVDWHEKSDMQKVEENIDTAQLHPKCASCSHNVLNEHSVCKKCDDFSEWTDKIEVDIPKEIHGSHKINKCCRCIYSGRPSYDYPCNECLYGSTHHFKPKEETK